MKHRGVICDKCGVEVTLSQSPPRAPRPHRARQPCSHVWFFKGLPSRIGHLLDISLRELEAVLYFESYVVVDPGDAPVKEREVIKDETVPRARPTVSSLRLQGHDGRRSHQGTPQARRVTELAIELRDRMKNETSLQKKLKYSKRLKIVEAFRKSDNLPRG